MACIDILHDKNGSYVINPQFDGVFIDFYNGLAAVMFGEKMAYVDKMGKIVWLSPGY